jgi:PAT family beta-lactamase induction signal transducer AmpG
MTMGFIISFFGCFQDVATDSMAVDIIPLDEQARANGLMWGGKVIGASVSLAAGTYMINKFGFSTGLLVPAAFTSLLILVPLYFLERKGEKRLPWTKGKASTMAKILQPANMWQILRDTYRVASRYSSLMLIGIMFLTGFAVAYVGTILPIFTIQELGWNNGEYSNLYASASLIGGILGMLIAGALVDFFGKKKMLFVYILMWVLASGLFLFYQLDWFGNKMASFTVFAIRTTETFATIAVFTMCMAHCWTRVSATQFTLYMTISNLGRSVGAASAGFVREYLNWYYTFAVVLVVLIVAILLIGFIRIQKQLKAIDRLEREALEKIEPVAETEILAA